MSVTKSVIEKVKHMDPEQKEYHQAVEEVMETLEPTAVRHPEFVKANIYERIVDKKDGAYFNKEGKPFPDQPDWGLAPTQ